MHSKGSGVMLEFGVVVMKEKFGEDRCSGDNCSQEEQKLSFMLFIMFTFITIIQNSQVIPKSSLMILY